MAFRTLSIVFVLFLAACAPQQRTTSANLNPYRQAEIDDAKSLIGKKIWVSTFGLTLCDAPTCTTELDSNATHFDLEEKYAGPLYVKDVLLPAFDYGTGLYIVVNTADGGTKYWYAISSRPSQGVLFQDPKVTAARAKATCDRKGGVTIGMSEAEVLASCWGKPQKKNITAGIGGNHEQWVYGDSNYLYFEGGILTDVQISR